MWTLAFQALSTRVELEVHASALVPTLRALVATYAPPDGTDLLRYRFEGDPAPRLLRDGLVIREAEELVDLPPIFELDLYRQLLARCVQACALHAAATSDGHSALLLCGASGSGKSTLALALVAAGERYLGDDCVVIHADGRVQGITRPIGVELGGVPTPGMTLAEYPYRDREGRPARATLVYPPADHLWHQPLAPGVVVLPQYAPGCRPEIQPVPPGEALRSLWPHVLNPGPGALDLGTSLVVRCPTYRMTTGRVDEALEFIGSIRSRPQELDR